MQNKRDSYNRDDLLASSQGELFGPGYPQLPAPNMLTLLTSNPFTICFSSSVFLSAQCFGMQSSLVFGMNTMKITSGNHFPTLALNRMLMCLT